jgi:preprotein translocase subunit SecD
MAQEKSKAPSITIGVYVVISCNAKTASKAEVKVGFPTDYRGASCLEQTPIAAEKDVESAALTKALRPPAVRLTLSAAGAERMLNATRNNIGGPMAVLVNGRLVSLPRIQAATPFPVIQGNLTQAQVDAILLAFRQPPR